MRAPRFDRRVQIQRATLADDGFASVEVWADHGAPLWAAKTDLSDGERWSAGEMAASVTTRFTLHRTAFARGLTPKDRLLCEGRCFEISGIKEGGPGGRFLELTCSARTDR
ncbi:head-tail adaptor [[Luteovulum] sphaeroides subsp. megalophilum]|uniref:head-tail adaptor protein n=1 Tax=Cereibacter sphaeroides TaxID=1063 RepID=UPI000B74FD3F|nr:head-tail adaptor protein [Cereibacter sphaeroides]SNT43597.1 head-tail adaptor [[Luteovulum] sphaeroides subsp. megalophilum]